MLKAFPFRSGTQWRFVLSPLLFSIVLGFFTSVIIQEKEIKIIKIEKEKLRNTKESTNY